MAKSKKEVLSVAGREVVVTNPDKVYFPQAGYNPSSGQVEHTKADHGRYVMHCHNVVHEDHAMMATWSIRPPTS